MQPQRHVIQAVGNNCAQRLIMTVERRAFPRFDFQRLGFAVAPDSYRHPFACRKIKGGFLHIRP